MTVLLPSRPSALPETIRTHSFRQREPALKADSVSPKMETFNEYD